MTRHRPLLLLLALFTYCLYAVILLHPLWVYNGSHVAGYDYFNYNWNFWWIRYASTNGLNVYLNDFVMFPAMGNYGYHALAAFWYPVWALLEPIAGTLTSINVIITIACVLNGFVFFVWLRTLGIHPGLSLLGGVVLQTLPITRYWYYNTHLNLMDWFWIPGLLLLWKGVSDHILARQTWSSNAAVMAIIRSLVFGVALWGLLMTDLQFPIFAGAIVAPYGLLTLWQAAHINNRFQVGNQLIALVACGLIAVFVGVALMWFAGPLPYIAQFEGGLVPSPVEDRPGIPLPEGWLMMAERWWSWDQPSVSWFFTLALMGSVVAAIARPRRDFAPDRASEGKPPRLYWFWLLVAIPPLVLALGPYVQVGEARVPMPFIGLYALTDGNFRMPWRLAPAGVIAGMTFLGLFWSPRIERWMSSSASWRRLAMTTFGAVVLLLSHMAVRLFETGPLEDVLPPYQGYIDMRMDGLDYVVLQAPTGMGTGEVLLGNPRAIQYQWYGITHEKRMINGFISRAPIEDFYSVDTEDALLSWLGQRRLLEPELVRAQLQERIFGYPIGYIVLHTDDIEQQSVSATDEITGFFNGLDDLLCPPEIEGAAVFYRTRWHPEGCAQRTPLDTENRNYEIDIGTHSDRRYLGWGWHYAEPVGGIDWRWIGGQPRLDYGAEEEAMPATVYVTLPAGDYQLVVTGQSFVEMRTLTITVNGERIEGSLQFEPDRLQEQTSTIFHTDAQGNLTIEFAVDSSLVPEELGMGDDRRQLSIAVERLRFVRIGAS